MADEEMKRVKELIAKKDEIEKEIKEFQEVLESVNIYILYRARFLHIYFIISGIFLTAKRCRNGW